MTHTSEHGATLATMPPPEKLPPFPTPGIGAPFLIAFTVLLLKAQGHPEEIVDKWQADATAAIRSPSIPPES